MCEEIQTLNQDLCAGSDNVSNFSHTQTHKHVNAPAYVMKEPGVNVSLLCPGRKWTRRSAQLDATHLLTLTTWVGQGRESVVPSHTDSGNTLMNPADTMAPATPLSPLGSFTFLFHRTRNCQMLSGSVICVSASLSSAAAGGSSHCSLADAYLISGTSGLLFRLRVGAWNYNMKVFCGVSLWVTVYLRFLMSEFVHLCVWCLYMCICGFFSFFKPSWWSVSGKAFQKWSFSLWIQLQKARMT